MQNLLGGISFLAVATLPVNSAGIPGLTLGLVSLLQPAYASAGNVIDLRRWIRVSGRHDIDKLGLLHFFEVTTGGPIGTEELRETPLDLGRDGKAITVDEADDGGMVRTMTGAAGARPLLHVQGSEQEREFPRGQGSFRGQAVPAHGVNGD